MAALILGAAAAAATAGGVAAGTISAALAAVITTAAAAIGSYIDQAFILPALFPPENIEGPRLGELRVQFAEEGAPLTQAFGSGIRNAGIVVWTSDLVEVERNESVGGGKGGGSSQSITTYEYYVSMAVMFCDTGGTPIGGLTEIAANGRPIYRDDPLIDNTLSGVSFTASQFIGSGETGQDITANVTTLGDYVAGGQVTISGATNPNNNGTFEIIAASSDPAGPTSTLRIRNPSGVAEGPTASVQFSQDVSNFSDELIESVEVYTGNTTQVASPTIEDIEGMGEVPGWRGYAYVVLNRLFLGEFGNTPPQFNFIYQPGTPATDGGMLQSIIGRGQLPDVVNAAMDYSGATTAVRGYSFTGATDILKAIQPIMIVGDVLAQNNNAGLRWFRRRDATIIDVDPDDLSAHPDGDEPTEVPVEMNEQSEIVRPEAVSVKYTDHQARYQGGTQREKANVNMTQGAELVVNVPVALENAGAEARSIARRLLYEGYINTRTVKLSLPMSYEHVQENDILRLRVFGHTWELLVTRKDRGDNFLIVIEANVEVRAVLDQPGIAEAPRGTSVDFAPGGGVISFNPYEPPPTIDHTYDVPGEPGTPIINVPTLIQGGRYTGAVVWMKRKTDDDSLYLDLGINQLQSIFGKITSALTTGRGIGFEYGQTLDIELFRGSVTSATDERDLLRGGNVILVNGEVIYFQTATLTGAGTYQLSGAMLRGRLGTTPAAHSADDPLWVLGTEVSNVESVIAIPPNWLGVECEVKAARPDQDLSEVPAVEITPQDGGLRPVAPVSIVMNWDSAGNITMRWSRISRRPGVHLFGPGSAPLSETVERYEVVVRDGDGAEALSIIVNDDNKVTITQAELTAVGLSTSDAIDTLVYQLNPEFGQGSGGRGTASEVTTRPSLGS